jgi:hypothetical protein
MAYLPLSTANLPNPAIDPAQGSSPEDYFNSVLYTANNNNGQSVTGVGFQPDFVWIKQRTTAVGHNLEDAVRGAGKFLTSETNAAQDVTGNLISFDSDGFTVGTGNRVDQGTNAYVAWNWKAGTSFSNSAGTNGASIASSGSANTDSGFSIVSYTGDSTGTNGTASTVFHGLSQAPEMIMFKPLDTYDGAVYHSGLTSASYRLILFSASGNAAEASDNGFFNGTAPTSSVFSIGSRKHTNSDGGMIAYCFHSVDSYSKISSYVGNGLADGPFVYTGFRPAYIIIKAVAITEGFEITDTKRDPYNIAYRFLRAHIASEETINTDRQIDVLSNGFKIRGSHQSKNTSGQRYIYMAFAENPFKYSNAR